MVAKISFLASQYAEILENYQNISRYFFHVQIGSIWNNKKEFLDGGFNFLALNPRQQNTNNELCKKIKDSLLNNENFHLFNRGIIFSAEKLEKNLNNGIVEAIFTNDSIQGNIDGAHTLKIIFKLSENEIEKIKNKLVFVEFITGIKDKNFSNNLSQARNSSAYLDIQSKTNLKGHYNGIKEILKLETFVKFKDRVNYVQNDNLDKNVKWIKVSEIINIMNLFNSSFYDFSKFDKKYLTPQKQKHKAFTEYCEKLNSYVDLKKKIKIWENIFLLWDEIEYFLLKQASKEKKKFEMLLTKGFVTKSKGGKKISKTKFYEEKELEINGQYYCVSVNFIYPVFCAFNCLIDMKNNGENWSHKPLDILNQIKTDFFKKIYEQAKANDINSVACFAKKSEICNILWDFVNEYKKTKM